MAGIATREKLIEAAKELFLAKGVDGASVRDIAAKAGIALSSMNYHFQSKEMLFEEIFGMLINTRANALKQILDSEMPIEEKIKEYVYGHIDLLVEDQLLVSFVLSVIYRNSDNIASMRSIEKLYNSEIFSEQLRKEIRRGEIQPVNPEQFYVSMISLIFFPFSIKPLIADRHGLDEAATKQFLSERKEIVYKMLMASLKK
ncbi:MAG: TetR/AcrR family transcriptional regulator [Rhodoferax sp.]|nr:TetR/AcrR family transcriptional regulator [Rhodoferax sp.]